MPTTNQPLKNLQIVYRGRTMDSETKIVELKERASFKNRSHDERLRLQVQLFAYLDELDKIAQECSFTQDNSDLAKSLESDKGYTLTIPDQISFSSLYVQSLTAHVKSVDIPTLRLSKDGEDYGLRIDNFNRLDGIKILMEDVSILKERGDEFFTRLKVALLELSPRFDEGLVFNIIPPRGLEGLARSFGSFEGWFTFIDEVKELGLNVAVMGQTEKAQIGLQLVLSLFSGSFNLNQVLGLINSSNPKSAKSGETNFFNNYSDNYTLSDKLLKELLKL